MLDHPMNYKRYTSQVKNNTILLLKQQQLYSSLQRQQQSIELNKDPNQQESLLIFKPESNKNLEPIVLRKFQQYFKKNSQQNNNIKIFDRILNPNQHASTLSPKKIQKHLPVTSITPVTTRDLAKLISKDQNFLEVNLKKQRKNNVYSSKSKHNQQVQSQAKQLKNISIIQETIKDQKIFQTFSNPIHFITKKQRRNDRFNKSTDLTVLLNKTIVENNQKSMHFQKTSPSLSLNDNSIMDFGYLKIQSSVLVDRKLVPQTSLNPSVKSSKQEQLKKSIRTKLISRKRILQESYRQKVRSRSPSPTKNSIRLNYIQFINPIGKDQFTLFDVIKVSITNSMIDEVKMNMNGCFFSVYVAEGNNSDLIKAIVRSISGWRVAQIPQVANFVWTQSYRKNLMDKKPKKIVRDEILEDSETYRSKQKLIDTSRCPKSNKFNQTFLVSRNLKKNSDSSKLLKRKSLQKIELGSRSKITSIANDANYIELSTKYITNQQPYSYENQVRKLLPTSFDIQNFVLKNQKDSKKITVTPNYLIHNHLIGHRAISDKKNLLFNLRKFYVQNQSNPFNYIPESHDIISCEDQFILKRDEIYLKEKEKTQIMKKEVWIVKPGQDSNRGRGIIVCKGWEEVVKEISKRIKQEKIEKDRQEEPTPKKDNQLQEKQSPQRYSSDQKRLLKKPPRTVILQRYIMPLLYQGRKFDIRSYMLVTWVNNVFNGYFYEECYIRTSSKQFDIDSQNKYVHLTNDAIQSMSHEYGKYEEGNKVSEAVFSKYYDSLVNRETKSWADIKKEMPQRCQHILKSSSKKLVGKFGHPFSSNKSREILEYKNECNVLKPQSISTESKKQKIPSLFVNTSLIDKQTEMSFELFGLDFMIDQNSKLWLIEVNTNPAINHDCSRILSRLIPKLLENTFAVAVMPYMRPSRISDSTVYSNQFHHIYQEVISE